MAKKHLVFPDWTFFVLFNSVESVGWLISESRPVQHKEVHVSLSEHGCWNGGISSDGSSST